MKLRQIIYSFISATALLGCTQDAIPLSDACPKLDGLCELIKRDTNCTNARQEVMSTAYEMEVEFPDSQTMARLQYEQLLNLETLKKCSYKQTLLEFISADEKFKNAERNADGSITDEYKEKHERHQNYINERKHVKKQNYINTQNYLSLMIKKTQNSKAPHLLYWHWSRTGDQDAVDTLIRQYERDEIHEYDILFYLSQEFSRYDIPKTKSLLLLSLEGYPSENYSIKVGRQGSKKYNPFEDDGRLHYPILRHLTQIYFAEQNFKAAYVFAKLLSLNNDITADLDMITLYMKKNHLSEINALDKLADKMDSDLDSDNFVRNHYTALRL